MSDRPLAVTAVAGLFLMVGFSGVVRPFISGTSPRFFSAEVWWILALSVLAVFCGALLLQRQSWARWLSLAWVAAHIGISFLDSLPKAAIHLVILLLIGYLLFRPDANLWFRGPKAELE